MIEEKPQNPVIVESIVFVFIYLHADVIIHAFTELKERK